jgi:hypothetical protein
LLSFGDKVEVISPASLRDELTRQLIDAAGLYLDDGIFTQEDKSMSYAGEFNVEDGAFTLDATSFIKREDEIAFSLTGVDEDGSFTMEGKAVLTKDGDYISGLLPVNYTHFLNEPGYASVLFSKVQAKNKSCSMKGLWIQDGEEWEIDGVLKEIH